jgi:hypothetical protein
MIEEDKQETLSDDLHFREYQLHRRKYNFEKDSYEKFLRKRLVIKNIPIFQSNNYPVLKDHDHPLFLQGPFINAGE